MRYYIYLDKYLLQNLFSTIENTNFNIEVIEYSIRKSNASSSGLSVLPSVETLSNHENLIDKSMEKECFKHEKREKLDKRHVGVSYECNDSCNIQTEKRYINIEDISNMKNNHFYHELIDDIIKNEITKENTKIKMVRGLLKKYQCEFENEIDGFFKLEDAYIWLNKKKLDGSVEILANMNCNISVLGYQITCNDKIVSQHPFLKAIAMFLE